MTALVAFTAGFQAEIVPSSVSKMKTAAEVDPGTANPPDRFAIIPVGAEALGLISARSGGGGRGTVTAGSFGLAAPVPSTSSDSPLSLVLIQKSPAGAKAIPQALRRFGF